MAFRGSPVLSCWIDRYEVRAWVRDEETRRGDLAVVRGDRARKPAAAGLKRKVGHRRVVSGRGLRIARTSICICAAARWASALAPDCAPASTDRYCWTLAIVTCADRWGGERVTRTPMGSRTQLCGTDANRAGVSYGRPDRVLRAVSCDPCPSPRVLSPPQLATVIVRRHIARRNVKETKRLHTRRERQLAPRVFFATARRTDLRPTKYAIRKPISADARPKKYMQICKLLGL